MSNETKTIWPMFCAGPISGKVCGVFVKGKIVEGDLTESDARTIADALNAAERNARIADAARVWAEARKAASEGYMYVLGKAEAALLAACRDTGETG